LRRYVRFPPNADIRTAGNLTLVSEQNFSGGLSRADKWGCATAFIVGLIVFAPLVFVDALGDCPPDTPCRKGFLLMVFLPSLVAAICAGLLARFIASKR
jgi:fructose-specific phosphotransferase system IIC component